MKFICVGKNYHDHIQEFDGVRPESPVLFMKPDTALHNMEIPFYIPEFTENLHHEVEVLVKINRQGKFIEPQFVSKYYDEIGLGIDLTARDVQSYLKERGLPWERSKSFDGSAIVGQFFPKENFTSLENIDFRLHKNGEIVQQSNTQYMLWKIDELIVEISQYFTLRKGDIIFTGTPAGVGRIVQGDVLEGYLQDKKSFSLQFK